MVPRRLLFFVSLALIVDTSAYAAITPLLPGISDEHGLGKGEAGLLSAAYPAGTLLFSLPAAWFASRFGPKPALLGGLGMLAVASLAFGLAGSAPALDAARLIQGAGAAAVWAGALAWIVAVSPRERRAEVIGAAVGAAIAGALGGPVLGSLADALGTGVVFGAYVALPLVMLVWGLRFAPAAGTPGMSLAALRSAAADDRMRRGMWLMTLPAVGFGVINVLVPLRLDDLGAGAAIIGATFLAAVALEAVMSPLVGRVADRRGHIPPARVGLAAGGLAVALLPIPDAWLLVSLGVVVAAPALGMLWAPALAMLSDGSEDRGLDPAFGFGLANLAWGTGATLGASGGGALAEVTFDAVPYVMLAALALGTAFALREAVGVPRAFAPGS